MGSNALATGEQSIAIGTGNQVTGNHAGAFGDPNIVSGHGSYAFGNNNRIEAENSFSMGNDTTISPGLAGAVVLGNQSTVTAAKSVSEGMVAGVRHDYAGAAPTDGHVVSVGSAGAERQIQNVAAGRISADSTDAVNGSQLHATNEELASVRADLADTSANLTATRSQVPGTWAADGSATYELEKSGTGGIPVRLTNLEAGEISAGSTDAVNGSQLHATNERLSVIEAGGATNAAAITATREQLPGYWMPDESARYHMAASGGTIAPVTLSGLAEGRVAARSTEAVTGGQLHRVADDVAGLKTEVAANATQIAETREQLPGRWSKDRPGTYQLGRNGGSAPVTVTNLAPGRIAAGSSDAVTGGQVHDLRTQIGAQGEQIAQNRREANAGISSAMALSMIRMDNRPDKLSVGFGLGTYKGATSLAMGAGYVSPNEKWRFAGGVTYGGSDDLGAALGLSYTFD